MVSNFKKDTKHVSPKKALLPLFWLLLLAMFVVLIVADVKIYLKRKELNSQIENLEQRIEDLKRQNQGLEEDISRSDDEQYIETIAREDLGLQQEGETAVSFVTQGNEKEDHDNQQRNIFDVWLGWIKNLFN